MSGRQIRWASVGRAAGIAAAAIAGIVSLPALLGGGSPPSVPPDVGLTPPAASAPLPAAAPSPVAAPAPEPRRPRRRLAGRRRTRPRRERTRPRRQHADAERTPAAPSPPAYSPPPFYSYLPPPGGGEFRFER